MVCCLECGIEMMVMMFMCFVVMEDEGEIEDDASVKAAYAFVVEVGFLNISVCIVKMVSECV